MPREKSLEGPRFASSAVRAVFSRERKWLEGRQTWSQRNGQEVPIDPNTPSARAA